MKRWILVGLVCAIGVVTAIMAHAAWQSFIKEYTYAASELDSKTSCRAIAIEGVKRQLLEELGTYVESTTVVKDYSIDKDEIRTLSAGVVQTKLLDEKWDGRDYWLKAEVSADPEEVAASIARVKNDSTLALELAESRSEKEEALKEVERLKAELADAKTDKSSEKLEQYQQAINQLQASGSFEQGTALAVSGDYEGAAKAYDRAIDLRPANAKAYFNRSIVYIYLGDYARATTDLDRAMGIRPVNTNIYYQRAYAYKENREKKLTRSQLSSDKPGRPLHHIPASDPLQRFLNKKQAEHNIVRVNPFEPKPRFRKADRPVEPGVKPPVINRNPRLDHSSPSHIEPGKMHPSKDRPIRRPKSLAQPDAPNVLEPQKPVIRKQDRVLPQQMERRQPITKPHVEPLRKKSINEADEEKRKRRKVDGEPDADHPPRR